MTLYITIMYTNNISNENILTDIFHGISMFVLGRWNAITDKSEAIIHDSGMIINKLTGNSKDLDPNFKFKDLGGTSREVNDLSEIVYSSNTDVGWNEVLNQLSNVEKLTDVKNGHIVQCISKLGQYVQVNNEGKVTFKDSNDPLGLKKAGALLGSGIIIGSEDGYVEYDFDDKSSAKNLKFPSTKELIDFIRRYVGLIDKKAQDEVKAAFSEGSSIWKECVNSVVKSSGVDTPESLEGIQKSVSKIVGYYVDKILIKARYQAAVKGFDLALAIVRTTNQETVKSGTSNESYKTQYGIEDIVDEGDPIVDPESTGSIIPQADTTLVDTIDFDELDTQLSQIYSEYAMLNSDQELVENVIEDVNEKVSDEVGIDPTSTQLISVVTENIYNRYGIRKIDRENMPSVEEFNNIIDKMNVSKDILANLRNLSSVLNKSIDISNNTKYQLTFKGFYHE